MAASISAMSMLLLASCLQQASASAFLQSQEENVSLYIAKQDIEQAVLSGLSGFSDIARLKAAEDDLRSMYNALPKGEHGKLEHSTVRYALHRYFWQRHGWYLLGLDRTDSAKNLSSAATIIKDRAPTFILSFFEDRLRSEGLGLHDLAVLVVTLSDLVHAEAVAKLERIFVSFNLTTLGSVLSEQLDLAIKAYLMEYLHDAFEAVEWKNASNLEVYEKELQYIYPFYNDTVMWAQDLRDTFALEQRSQHNPFVEQEQAQTFEDGVSYVQAFAHRFGSYQNLECVALKNILMKREVSATGRVLLSDFYSIRGDTGALFSESPAYLRHTDALDETDPSKPSVMIANYMTSFSNCLASSSFYSICCINECDQLLGQLESEIGSPSAAPSQIAGIVSRLRSDTVDAPRNLSAALLARLEEIADFNGGLVPLHGRLFAQWMHHAYPRECPFPAVGNTAEKKMMPSEWELMGHAYEATYEEMKLHRSRRDDSALTRDTAGVGELPWVVEEELVVEEKRWTSSSLQSFMVVVAVLSFAMPLVRATAVVLSSTLESMPEKGHAAPVKPIVKLAKKKKKPQEWVA